MSSGAAAATMALGLDRGLPFPLEDIPQATTILLVGANIAETMPPLMQYFEAQQRARRHRSSSSIRGGRRRRRGPTGIWRSGPGTDAALANGLLHVLIRDDLIDAAYIRDRTEGFEEVAAHRGDLLARARRADHRRARSRDRRDARIGSGRRAHPMILTARGPEQQSQGVNNTLAYINIALALGAVGKPFSGFGCLTGQGNGQGGREHGQKADQLPGYRRIDDDGARAHMADVWGVPASAIPGVGQVRVRAADVDRPRRRRARAARHGIEHRRLGAERVGRARAAEGARVPRRRGLLPVRDGASWPTSCCRARSGPKKKAR